MSHPGTDRPCFPRAGRILLLPYLITGVAALLWILVLDNAPIFAALPVCGFLALPFVPRDFAPRWYLWSSSFLVTSILVMRFAIDLWLPV